MGETGLDISELSNGLTDTMQVEFHNIMDNMSLDALSDGVAMLTSIGNGDEPYDADMGLCYAFEYASDIKSTILKPFFLTWPKFSGDIVYPVPHEFFDSPYDAYQARYRMYDPETQYGSDRRELALHLAEELERWFL